MKKSRYEDIIGLSRPVIPGHPPMDREARAAQFSPFAALTGYDEAVKETGRLTDRKAELSEDQKDLLDQRLRQALRQGREGKPAVITFFVEDERKAGGSYRTAAGCIQSVESGEGLVVMEDGIRIPLDDIVDIQV